MEFKKEKLPLSKKEIEEQLNIVMTWVTEQIENQQVPRFSDVLDHTFRVFGFKKLKKSQILKRLRLHPSYFMNSTQARKKLKSGKHRPIIVNSLGNLHGDIGFYPMTREYETPVTFRSGFLVCVDILSRFKYVSILKKNRTAESMIHGFNDIFEQFRKQNNGLHVRSISFDQERSVMSHKVQAFFKEKNVKFHPFANTASKSKMAENAIKQIRTTVARLKGNTKSKEIRWWHLIKPAIETLNQRPIKIGNKYLTLPNSNHPYYTPYDVNPQNVKNFISKINRAAPSHYFAQFSIAPQTVKFKYQIGDLIRPKLIIISSEVIGTKRSEISLANETFVIKKQVPFMSAAHTIEKAYLCQSLLTNKEETFSEDDIALSNH